MLRNVLEDVVTRVDRLLVPARTSVYPLIILALWLPVWVVMMSLSGKPLMVDLVARWTGGRMVTQGDWPRFYDPEAQSQVQRHLFNGADALSWFVGPPFEAVVLAPLGTLPYGLAIAVWTTASVGCLLVALWLLRAHVGLEDIWWRRMLILSLGSMATLECLFSGQNSTFLLLVFTLAWVALRSGRDFLGGAILGLALVKPHLIVLMGLLWLLEGRWKALAGFAATATAWVVLAALVLDVSAFGRWLSVLRGDLYTEFVTVGQTSKHGGPAGFFTDVLGPIGVSAGIVGGVISLMVGAAAVVWVRYREPEPTSRWWLAVLASVVFAPHSMIYDLVIIIPSVAIALSRWWTPTLRVTLALAWVGLWVLPLLSSVLGVAVHGALITLLALCVLLHAGRPSVNTAGPRATASVP